MNKVKPIADNDQRKLICELCLLYFVQMKKKSNKRLLIAMPTKPSWCFPPLESCSSAAKQNIQKTLQSPGQNIYLQKVLHSFWVVAVTFTADSFHFLYLTSLASCLDVLEVNIWILTKVYNGTQEIEQSWKESHVLNTVRSEVSEGCMGFSL